MNNIKHRRQSSRNPGNLTGRSMSKNRRMLDSYKNTMSGLGGQFDPMNRLTYNVSTVLSKGDVELLYRQDWLSRKIVEAVPDDVTRKWIDIHIGDDSVVQGLNTKMKKLKVIKKFKEALVNARLYKGSVIILGVLDGKSPDKPLDYDNIEDLLYLNVIDAYSLNVKNYYKDPFNPNYGEPKLYRLCTQLKPDKHDPTNDIIHESRLIRFDGAYLPEFLRRMNNGWNDSILNSINQALKQYGTSMQSGALLFQDFISKILKMPNLGDLLQSEDGRAILDLRIQYAIASLSSIGIVLIGEDEEFTKTQTPISGLSDLMDKYIEAVAAASNIPRSRLFGQSLGTLAGATETTRAYYDYCAAYQRDHLKDQVSQLIKILLNCKNGVTNGVEPKEWDFKFCSLWDETNKEVTTARKMQAQVDDLYIEKGVLTPEEVTASRFRPDGYSFDTIVNINQRLGEFFSEQKVEPDSDSESDKNEMLKSLGKDAPVEVKNIADTIYSGARCKFKKDTYLLTPHEDEMNKELCKNLVFRAIEYSGWYKDSKDKWINKKT